MLRNIAKSFGYISKRKIIKKAVTLQRKIQRLITLLVFRCFVIIKRTENLQLLNIESGVPADVYPADTTKSPARRPGGFEIRRKKRFDLLKSGDL